MLYASKSSACFAGGQHGGDRFGIVRRIDRVEMNDIPGRHGRRRQDKVPLWGGEVAKSFKDINQGGSLWVFKLPKT